MPETRITGKEVKDKSITHSDIDLSGAPLKDPIVAGDKIAFVDSQDNSLTKCFLVSVLEAYMLTQAKIEAKLTGNITSHTHSYAPLTSPTFATSITGSFLTASEILATNASKNIVSLPVATYPSLSELIYLKGVTSAIQTQLNAKGTGDMTLAGIQAVTGAKTFDKDKLLMKGTSTGVTTLSTLNTSSTSYTATLQAASGTLAYLTDVTYANLNTNGSVGTGATQVAVGNHTHSGLYVPVSNFFSAPLTSGTSGTAGYTLIGNGISATPVWDSLLYVDRSWSAVGIGTTDTGGYKLNVNGHTNTTELTAGKYNIGTRSGSFMVPSFDQLVSFGGEPVFGTGVRYDLTAFQTGLVVEKRELGGTWVSIPMNGAAHKGAHTGLGVIYEMPHATHDAIRFTWSWGGDGNMLIVDSILCNASSNSSNLYITVQRSTDNVTYTNLVDECYFGNSWPAFHFLQKAFHVNYANPLYFRVIIRSDRANNAGFIVSSISVYGNFTFSSKYLYTWDFDKKVTFVNDAYVNSNKVLHEGNHSHRTDANNDSRYLQLSGGTMTGNLSINDLALRIRGGGDVNHAIQYDATTNGPFAYGYSGTALGYINGGTPTRTLYTYNDKVFIPSITFSANKLIIMTPANGLSTIADGANGYFLQTNGSGTYTWAAATSTNNSGWTDNGNNISLTTSTDYIGIGASPDSLRKVSISNSNNEIYTLSVTNTYSSTSGVAGIFTASGTNSIGVSSSGVLYGGNFTSATGVGIYCSGVASALIAYSTSTGSVGIQSTALKYDYSATGSGIVNVKGVSSGSVTQATGYGQFYYNSTDNHPHFKNEWQDFDLAAGTSSQWTTDTYGIKYNSGSIAIGAGLSSDAGKIVYATGTGTYTGYFQNTASSGVNVGVAGVCTATTSNNTHYGGYFAATGTSGGIGAYGLGYTYGILAIGSGDTVTYGIKAEGKVAVLAEGFTYDVWLNNSGRIMMKHGTAGTPSTGFANIYVKSDGKLWMKNGSNTEEIVGGQSSDFWLKKDFRKLEKPLETILKVNGYSFNWKQDYSQFAPKDAIAIMLSNDTGKRDASGVIAQELEKLIPEAINTNADGYKSVNFNHVVPYMIEAIKELNSKIETLESKLSKYE
jgi:hypothetical protein